MSKRLKLKKRLRRHYRNGKPIGVEVLAVCERCGERQSVMLRRSGGAVNPQSSVAFCPCGFWLARVSVPEARDD